MSSLVLCACQGDETLGFEDAWARHLAAAMCSAAHENECGCELGDGSQAECEDRQLREIRDTELDARRDGYTFDPECAQEHIAAVEQLACTPVDEYLDARTHPMCQIYVGDKKLGESCTVHSRRGLSRSDIVLGRWMSDCEQGLLCVLSRCVTPQMPYVELEPDAPCVDMESGVPLGQCPEGQGCNLESGQCEALVAQGDSCADGEQCMDAWCDGNTCLARKPDGKACTQSQECSGGSCDEGTCRTWSVPAIDCVPFAL